MRASNARQSHGDAIAELREGPMQRCASMLYGKLPASQVPQVAMLSGILFCIIGVYWLLRSLKVGRASRYARIRRALDATADRATRHAAAPPRTQRAGHCLRVDGGYPVPAAGEDGLALRSLRAPLRVQQAD
jgi:hypothetical protein